MPDAVEVARASLIEFAPAGAVGELLERVDGDDGVTTVRFGCLMSGYPGWHWEVSLASVGGEPPTVLETELMPAEGALLAPEWVPWADRLEEWHAAQAESADAVADDDDDDDDDADESDDELDDDSDDEADESDFGLDLYDGVDVHEHDIDPDDDDEDDDEDDDVLDPDDER